MNRYGCREQMGPGHFRLARLTTATLLALVLVNGLGCQKSQVSDYLDQRAELLLLEEPDGALSLEEAKEHVQEQAGPVVFLGRIGSNEDSTWDPGRAAFVVTDPAGSVAEDDSHAHAGHDPETCPFCNAQANHPSNVALVQMVDKTGAVIPVDARKLLAVRANQIVVVRGLGRVDDLGHLVVDADGIYLRH